MSNEEVSREVYDEITKNVFQLVLNEDKEERNKFNEYINEPLVSVPIFCGYLPIHLIEFIISRGLCQKIGLKIITKDNIEIIKIVIFL